MSEEKNGNNEEIRGEGFTIKDRRHFTSEGERRQGEEPREEKKKEQEKREVRDETGKVSEEMPPLPEVTFSTFVLSLSTSCLLHFGEIPDPVTRKQETNLPMAKHAIDTLAMLQEKTKGNLSKEEEDLLENVLYNMRIKYVDEAKKP
jgi:hypothetical protein